MPCGTFQANATFFAICVLTYDLYLCFRSVALGKECERTQVQTVRWRLFQTAGKIVRHGRQTFLKINSAMLAVFTAIRGVSALHAGRMRHTRNVMITSAAFSPSLAPT